VRRAILKQVADAASRPRPENSTFALADGTFVDFAISETVFLCKRLPSARRLSSYAVPQTVNSTRALSMTAVVEFSVVFDSCSPAHAATTPAYAYLVALESAISLI
jgi:hypothetical protein